MRIILNISNNNLLIPNRSFYIKFYIKKNGPKINQRLVVLVRRIKTKIIKLIF